MKSQILRSATPAVLLATLILFPFLGKAFTIDDNVSGCWPWVWGDSVIDAFDVWQIN